jgi:copper(I)-binding protein
MIRSIRILIASFAVASAFFATPSFAQSNTIKVDKPWARATPAGASVGGGYATLRNTGTTADRLVGASSPVSARTEMHEMTMVGNIMKMREVKGIEVPANGAIELKPGSYHLMFIELKAPLKQGEKVPVTLKFEKAGDVKVELAVEAMGAAAGSGHGDMKKH